MHTARRDPRRAVICAGTLGPGDYNPGSMSGSRRIYLDHAATSFPKPPGVAEAVADAMTRLASPGRGAYAETLEAASLLHECRSALCGLFNGRDARNVIFTLNATDALNLAIKGVVAHAQRRGGEVHVVTTALDHNSVLRPLRHLEEQGVAVSRVPLDPRTGRLDPLHLREALRAETALVAMHHASNVSGTLQPIAACGEICRAAGVPLLIDAAQTLGHVPVDVDALGIDLLAFPGHKGLLGPLGTGGLYIRPGLEERMATLREGGTGSASELDRQPDDLPDRFEPGSHNTPGLIGLLAAVKWIRQRGVAALRAHEVELMGGFLEGVRSFHRVSVLGPQGPLERVGVFSVVIEDFDPHALARELEARHGILARAGLHCAPLAHRTFGTFQRGGATRVSFGPFTSGDDVQTLIEAFRQLARSQSSASRPATLQPTC
jgi:cysteine desulfurase / selenocysteine lyase